MNLTASPPAVPRRPLARLAAAIAVVGCLAGAASAAAAPAHATANAVVHVRVDRNGIHAPQRLRPGITTFAVSSHTNGTSSLLAARLHDGVTYVQVQRDAQSGLAAVLRDVDTQGGLAHIGKHTGHSWTTRLRRGNYLLVDDESNFFAPLQVAGPSHRARPPKSSGTVAFTRRGLRLPKRFGDGTWRFVNHDRITHELGLLQIRGHHTKAQALDAITRPGHPRWLPPAGTLNDIGPGQTAWFSLHHLHGRYLLADYLPAFQGVADGPIAVFHRFG